MSCLHSFFAPEFEIKILDERLKEPGMFPAYATPMSAGIDLRACISFAKCKEQIVDWNDIETEGTGELTQITLQPNQQFMIPSGIALHMDNSLYAAVILPRSGLGTKGLVLANTVGLIDSDYQKEMMITAWNRSSEPIVIKPMERIAQMVIIPVVKPRLKLVYEFSVHSERGGFGSTGSK